MKYYGLGQEKVPATVSTYMPHRVTYLSLLTLGSFQRQIAFAYYSKSFICKLDSPPTYVYFKGFIQLYTRRLRPRPIIFSGGYVYKLFSYTQSIYYKKKIYEHRRNYYEIQKIHKYTIGYNKTLIISVNIVLVDLREFQYDLLPQVSMNSVHFHFQKRPDLHNKLFDHFFQYFFTAQCIYIYTV